MDKKPKALLMQGNYNMKKKISKSSAKKKAWKTYSEYIRRSYADAFGYLNCYTCGIKMFWKESDCGHGMPGRNNAVLFMEEVCRPQCIGCNVFGRGKIPLIYHETN